MARLHYNGLEAYLGATLTAAATTATFRAKLTHAGGDVPTLGAGDTITLAILGANGLPVEYVDVTAYTAGATTATVTRAREGTAAAEHPVGRRVVAAATALDFRADAIPSTPTGTVAAVNVQAAIAELDAEKIALTEKAAPNGVATLDAGGLLPDAQSPAIPRWRPNTAYAAGDIRSAPDGSTIRRKTAATSAAAFDAPLAVPAPTAPTTATTGGTLTPGTYSYRVSALNALGETLASAAVSATIAGPLAAPVLNAPTTATTGGTLAAGTYYYKITALNAIGETVGSNEVSQATTGTTSTVDLSWAAVAGATGYKVYRATATGGTSTSPALVATLGAVTSYTDTGTAVSAGAVPATNTTSTNTNTVTTTWAAVTGATGYKVYGRTAGGELLIATLGAVTTYTDTGAVTPAGALPTADTTAEKVHWTPVLATAGTMEQEALAASYAGATVCSGTGIDPTGATDSAAAIQAKIDATPAGGWCIVPTGKYKLLSGLTISKTIRFGGSGAPRTGNDNSDLADVGVEFRYDGTSGDAILVQPPNATNSRIGPVLENFLVRGNRNVAGAAGGGITLSGRNLTGTAINGFALENVHIADAKGDGLTVADNVYEGRVVGMYASDCGGHGIVSTAAGGGLPGEILLADIHANDNVGDGIRLRGGGTWDLLRITASRNTGSAVDVDGCLLRLHGLQAESNSGATVVKLSNLSQGLIAGSHISYLTPGYTGVGISAIACGNTQIIGALFSESTTGDDIATDAACAGVTVHGYSASAGTNLNFTAGNGLADAFVGAHVYPTAGQSLAADTLTALTFDAELIDTSGLHSTVTNTSRFTVPNGLAGYYRVKGCVGWVSSAGTNKVRTLSFRKNNSSIYETRQPSGAAGDNPIHDGEAPPVYLAEGDYVEMFAAHYGEGAAISTLAGPVYTWFAIERIGS